MAVEFICRYPTSFTLTTKEITVKKTATSAEETFAQTGSWASSLSMNFKDENWEENLADDYVSVLGSTLRVDVGWSIYERQGHPYQ